MPSNPHPSRKSRTRAQAMVLAVFAAAAIATPYVRAADTAPTFASIFNDHAVVQRDAPITVWGKAAPRATVTVQLAGATAQATADGTGAWRATLPAMQAGGPHALRATVNGASTTLNDIMVGDVFLCSGQSNMELNVANATNAEMTIGTSANRNIRFANVAKDSSALRRDDFATVPQWQVTGPETTAKASAVCYYMARALQRQYGVPVGFINASWGGTTIQGWIGAASLRTLPAYRESIDVLAAYGADMGKGLKVEERRQEAWWDKTDPKAAAQRAWASPRFDDSRWADIELGKRWNESDAGPLREHRGVAWFRTTVDLTARQAAAGSHLLLGQVAAADTAWVNGVRVGAGDTWWMSREYALPKGTLKEGRNVIAVRVLGDENGGGLLGAADARALRTADGEKIALPTRWKFQAGSALSAKQAGDPWQPPTSLATLYNGMIAPLQGYRFKAVAWYQGESNAGAAQEYRTLLPMLFADWRRAFGQPDLPFLVAQLAAFGKVPAAPGNSGWAELRQAQSIAVRDDPHAGLAVTFDHGDRTDIHPSQKAVVGERLARAARAVAYGDTIAAGGPRAETVTRDGKDLLVRFARAEGGLRTYASDSAIGFEACERDACRYVRATASGDTVRLKDAATPGVTKVRYAWADAPFVNLFGQDDLPADGFEMEVK
ncbi:sialate O-acetylesterase [Massilia sp. METH4]|uniref:sialate O-acetylesterase n=1 Tax=Massilia sp. METH4 TaxID=3123041 RepID=UPI0030D0D40E